MKSREYTANYSDHVTEKCIECGKCIRVCPFLSKYEMDLKGYCSRKDLAYSCFKCGECKFVCPLKLDGRLISQEHRRCIKSGMSLTRLIKGNYPFKNNLKGDAEDIFFPGCNFSAFYPETTKAIIELFIESGQDFDFDCCGLPVYETGDESAATKAVERIDRRLKKCSRVVTACPNCFHFLKSRLDIDVITIYKLLSEKGIGKQITGTPNIYFPCPDRESLEIFADMEPFLGDFNDAYREVICCGMGGLASGYENELAKGLKNSLNGEVIHTYCATCSHSFSDRNDCHHLTSVILGIDEPADSNFLGNSLKFKLYRRKSDTI